jgi:hypothetical protein
MDPGETPEETALRELSEELGLTLSPLCVAGPLDDFATRSGFVVTPVVVLAEGPIECVPDPAEVAEVHRVPLALLDRPDCPRLVPIPESERPVLSIPIHGSWVHAPTAAIVYQLFEAAYRGRVVRVAHVEQPVFAWR